jgi:hypothetical protein
MPRKPEPGKNLVFNVSVKVTEETLDALEIIRRVTGAPAGATFRDAFEDQVAGLTADGDRGIQAVREYRNEKKTRRILNLNAWADKWAESHPELAGPRL